jgi:enediyne biosynthesis protein E4
MIRKIIQSYSFLVCFLILSSCRQKPISLFTKLDGNETGIHFSNDLLENSDQFNIMQYPYFYNGGGVAVGDLNNDGLLDIVFTGNMVKNRIYINKGNFKFEDITEKSGIASQEGWCTGVTLADVNADGWLDIYICRSGFSNDKLRRNLLFINNHDGTFTEEAAAYGIDDPGYSTQASFFDYDKDGDLDLFVINQSRPQYAQGGQEYAQLRNKPAESIYQNHLYRNDGGHFTDVTKSSGINSNALTFSLGVSTADINQDGWPDIYISNDFNEPDYLFINNHDGTFSEKLKEKIDHTSLYSMGCDIADYNNDALPDICTLDMLPENNHDIKMHTGADNYDKFNYLSHLGFGNQYMKNSLQKNNGDGTFSEIGQLAGISNTDWSWSPLFADFDNDGLKDLFISNGYKRDNTNLQFIKYTMNESIRMQQGGVNVQVKDYVANMDGIYIDNYMYHNTGNDRFENKIRDWGLQGPSFSNGAVYADLDNDGDLDLVTNNIDGEAGIYRNNNEIIGKNNYLRVQLKGQKNNALGIGSKVYAYANHQVFYLEQLPVRGYQSSVDMTLHFGLGHLTHIDSLRVIWPDDHTQVLKDIKPNQTLRLDHGDATQVYVYPRDDNGKRLFNSEKEVLKYMHSEAAINDFDRQRLLPRFYSHNGPCMAKADVNGDGLEDLYIGGSKGKSGALFLQTRTHRFVMSRQPSILADSLSEDVDAVFFDANGDHFPDLYVVSGGYDIYSENSPLLADRLYLNDGKGHFTKSKNALPDNRGSKSCVRVCDIDGDGDLDLFIGGKVTPGKWPVSCKSSIYINNGKGKFTDETDRWSDSLKNIGMVTDAVWADINHDGRKDLIVVGEWMQPTIFINEKNHFNYSEINKQLSGLTGWWNTIIAGDFDRDGDIDLVIGNEGFNSQLKPSVREPVRLYVSDIDGDGILDPVMTSFVKDTSYPFVSMDDINKQVPSLRKTFYDYRKYADATIEDVLPREKLLNSRILEADTFETLYLENTGSGFVVKHLPVEAQYSPVYSILSADVNGDGYPDLILFGNNTLNRIRLGRSDANHGVVLVNDGKANFTNLPPSLSGLSVRGDVRSSLFIGKQLFIGVNNDSVRVFTQK